jgi:hypothetical protein
MQFTITPEGLLPVTFCWRAELKYLGLKTFFFFFILRTIPQISLPFLLPFKTQLTMAPVLHLNEKAPKDIILVHKYTKSSLPVDASSKDVTLEVSNLICTENHHVLTLSPL